MIESECWAWASSKGRSPFPCVWAIGVATRLVVLDKSLLGGRPCNTQQISWVGGASLSQWVQWGLHFPLPFGGQPCPDLFLVCTTNTDVSIPLVAFERMRNNRAETSYEGITRLVNLWSYIEPRLDRSLIRAKTRKNLSCYFSCALKLSKQGMRELSSSSKVSTCPK